MSRLTRLADRLFPGLLPPASPPPVDKDAIYRNIVFVRTGGRIKDVLTQADVDAMRAKACRADF